MRTNGQHGSCDQGSYCIEKFANHGNFEEWHVLWLSMQRSFWIPAFEKFLSRKIEKWSWQWSWFKLLKKWAKILHSYSLKSFELLIMTELHGELMESFSKELAWFILRVRKGWRRNEKCYGCPLHSFSARRFGKMFNLGPKLFSL